MKLGMSEHKKGTPEVRIRCTQDTGQVRSVHWKYNCCASDWPNARLHAGHLRCRVDMRMSIHDLQNATRKKSQLRRNGAGY
jgi:hypothetical protein